MLTWELPSARVTTSSCAGEVIAELMLMSLMMKSGLYHHPADDEISPQDWLINPVL